MRRVLLIDDNDISLQSMRRILEREFEVVCASWGDEGLRLYSESHFDLIITDIFLPDTDGLEVIQRLKALDPSARIIAVSGGSSMLDPDHILATAGMVGACTCLAKPFTAQQLYQVATRMLEETPAAS